MTRSSRDVSVMIRVEAREQIREIRDALIEIDPSIQWTYSLVIDQLCKRYGRWLGIAIDAERSEAERRAVALARAGR